MPLWLVRYSFLHEVDDREAPRASHDQGEAEDDGHHRVSEEVNRQSCLLAPELFHRFEFAELGGVLLPDVCRIAPVPSRRNSESDRQWIHFQSPLLCERSICNRLQFLTRRLAQSY